MFRFVRSCFAWVAFLCVLPSGVLAQSTGRFIHDQAYWIGENAVSGAEGVHWAPYQGILRLGYGEAPVWIKLSVAPLKGQKRDDPIRINVMPAYLDQIELIDPLERDKNIGPVGDLFPLSNSAIPSLTHNFLVVAGDAPRTIYLKVKTSSSKIVDITAAPPEDAHLSALMSYSYSGVMLLVSVMFFAWACYNLLLIRDSIARSFVVLQGVFLCYVFFILGFGRLFLSDYLSPSWGNAITSELVVVLTFLSINFYLVVFSEYLTNPRCCQLLKRPVMMTMGLLMALVLWRPVLALEINSFAAIALSLFFLLLSVQLVMFHVSATGSLLPSKIHLLLYFTVLNILNISSFLRLLGFEIDIGSSVYGPVMNGVMSGVFLLFLMHTRGRRIRQIHLEELHQKQKLLDSEQKKTEEIGQFVDLIAHEVRTPLSMISLALDGEQPSSRLQELACYGVAEIQALLARCSLLGDLNNDALSPIYDTFSPKVLVEDLIAANPDSKRFELYCADLSLAKADVALLRIVVGNLLENAVKYGAEDCDVRVVIHRAPSLGHWAIEVTNKIGVVGAPDLNSLFQRHYRAPKAVRTTGSGLGLYLSKRLMNLQGGDLCCDISGQYIRFIVTLPIEVREND